MKLYVYGMLRRGFSPGCQPKDGFVERRDSPTDEYWDIIVYSRDLATSELFMYDLDFIGTEVRK